MNWKRLRILSAGAMFAKDGRSDQMQYECKITVLETKVFPELQEKYLADPKSGPCPFFKA